MRGCGFVVVRKRHFLLLLVEEMLSWQVLPMRGAVERGTHWAQTDVD
jgi:hypothetical protein